MCNPDKLTVLPHLLEKYKGAENKWYRAVSEKYDLSKVFVLMPVNAMGSPVSWPAPASFPSSPSSLAAGGSSPPAPLTACAATSEAQAAGAGEDYREGDRDGHEYHYEPVEVDGYESAELTPMPQNTGEHVPTPDGGEPPRKKNRRGGKPRVKQRDRQFY